MKITFKDVGQGDSILLEWDEDGISKIGIIDCNKKYRTNPIRDYINDSDYKEIEFIILSHPHADHYSGMVELLDLLEKQNIRINFFGHTLHLLGTDYHKYLTRVEIDTEALKMLQNLFNKVDVLRKSQIIKKVVFISEDWQRELKTGITIKCLSPSETEASTYMNFVNLQPFENKKAASSNANYLSTLFKLTIDDKYYLLTSDTEALTFERLLNQNIHKNLHQKEMGLCQLPHHGALKNHYQPFWNFINKKNRPKAVVSAGLHEKYKHPHLPVLIEFHNNGYDIHSTNIVYGMLEFTNQLKKIAKTGGVLDTFSELIRNPTGGDKSFNLPL